MATQQQKEQDFLRLFPQQVEMLIDRLKKLQKKSNKYNYSWDQDTVHDAFVLIARCFAEVALSFNVKFEVTVDGQRVELVEPKRGSK